MATTIAPTVSVAAEAPLTRLTANLPGMPLVSATVVSVFTVIALLPCTLSISAAMSLSCGSRYGGRCGRRFDHLALQPPRSVVFSTSRTSWPAAAASSAAESPVAPPPTTMIRLLSPSSTRGSGAFIFEAWATPMRIWSAAAIWVSSSPAGRAQATHSRRFVRTVVAPSKSKRSAITRCEQAAMIGWLTAPSLTSLAMRATPSSLHSASCCRHSGIFRSPEASVSRASQSTAPAMPQPLQI